MRAKVGQFIEFRRDYWQSNLKVTQYHKGRVECMLSTIEGVERYLVQTQPFNEKPKKLLVSEFQIEHVEGAPSATPEITKEMKEASWQETTYLVRAKRGQPLKLL